MSKKSKTIAIIGCGNMGAGIARRLSSHNTLFLYDRNPQKMKLLQKDGCGTPCFSLEDAFKKSEILILAIKPQGIKEFAHTISPKTLKHTIISLLSGTTLDQLKAYFPGQKIVRMMPNLAVLCGESTVGLSADDSLSKTDLNELNTLCSPLGKIYWLPESKFNAFTALTGSGIAFVFALIESMVEAGISMGFNAVEAQEMVQQTVKGGLSLLDSSKEHPAALKWKVTSPGGTTIAGLRKFEEYGVRGGVINTFLGAYQRAIELSN